MMAARITNGADFFVKLFDFLIFLLFLQRVSGGPRELAQLAGVCKNHKLRN
jgi:hypothetical protein